MNARAQRLADDHGFVPNWSEKGALRQKVGEHGRVHIDRWLPFVILHRAEHDRDSLSRQVAINSPSYMVWSAEDDESALSAIEAVAAELCRRCGTLLAISLDDGPPQHVAEDSSELPPIVARLAVGEGQDTSRAADKIERGLSKVEIDLRPCEVERGHFEPLLPDPFDRLLSRLCDVRRIALTLPPVHCRADGGAYPAIRREMVTRTGDILLRAAHAFLEEQPEGAPAHHRALGRSAYLAAALKADRGLDKVANCFDFLMSISPINMAQARAEFIAGGCEQPPVFHYRPLTVDPDLAKRSLYNIELDTLEDPLLETLLGDKRREIDAQLSMLATRNTPAFRAASMFLYGAVGQQLLDDALTILAATANDPPRGPTIGASEVAAAANALFGSYRSEGAFAAEASIRHDVSGLLVTGPCLMIGKDTVIPRSRLRSLLAHEVSVHLLTYFNGAGQGLSIFRTGLAGYEGFQEGLGVFAEWATGGLTRTRLRLLAGRVVAVEAMLKGATFIDTWRLLAHEHGFSRGGAFGIVARVFRSGGLAKDAIYLQGFRAVLDMVIGGAALDPFWLGKIAVNQLPAVEELLDLGLVVPPLFTPEFLSDPDTSKRIARLKDTGSIHPILRGESIQ